MFFLGLGGKVGIFIDENRKLVEIPSLVHQIHKKAGALVVEKT